MYITKIHVRTEDPKGLMIDKLGENPGKFFAGRLAKANISNMHRKVNR